MTGAVMAVPARRRRRRDTWLETWAIVRANRQAMLGVAILAAFTIIAVFGPLLAGPIDRAAANRPMLSPCRGGRRAPPPRPWPSAS